MKPIIVCEKNERRIMKILDVAQKGATDGRVSFDGISEYCNFIYNYIRLPPKKLEGCIFMVDEFSFPYSRRKEKVPYSTVFTVKYTRGHWSLIGLERVQTHNGRTEIWSHLTPEAQEFILKQTLEFDCTSEPRKMR